MLKKLACLFCAVTNDHGAEAVVLVGFSEFGEVVQDVIEHRADEVRMGVDFFAVKAAFFDFKLRQCSLQFDFVLAADGLANQAQGVAVSDGGVVIVFMDVVAEELAGLTLPAVTPISGVPVSPILTAFTSDWLRLARNEPLGL